MYSKGPWSVYHDGMSVCAADGHIVSTAVEGVSDEQAKANARLIAAAPELKDALVELLAAELAMFPPFDAGKEAQDAWADRQAAARNNASFVIAKATGR